MAHINTSQLKTKLGNYKTAEINAVSQEILNTIKDYKKNIASRYVALGKEQIMDEIKGEHFFVSAKLDGEFYCALIEESTAYLVSRSGIVSTGLPCTKAIEEIAKSQNITSALIPGELFVQKEGARERVFEVIKALKSPKNEEDLAQISFAPFDILELNGKSFVAEEYTTILQKLTDLFGQTNLVKPVTTIEQKDTPSILSTYEDWVEKEGREGIVVRSVQSYIYKVKPRHSIDAVVVGYVEGIDDKAGLLGSVLVALVREDGKFQLLGRVGGGFSKKERAELLTTLKKLAVKSEYIEPGRNNIPYTFVEPKIIIEFDFIDALTFDADDIPFNKMALEYKDGLYSIVKKVPFVSLLSPVFIRIRDDKEVNSTDLRLSQLTDLVYIENIDKPVERTKLPKSEIILREVYKKEYGGSTMVRKFIVWKTNKEKEDNSYLAYVFAFTDYSTGRKDPLSQEIRVSNDKDQIMEICKTYIEEQIKKGWEKVE